MFVKEIANLNAEYPHTSFSNNITADDLPLNVAIAIPNQPPTFNDFQLLIRLDPAFNMLTQRWEYGWSVINKSNEECLALLAAKKAEKNVYINAERLRANQGSFTHAGKTFACDPLSRSDIDWVNGWVATSGNMPPGWIGGWKAVDNTYISLPDVASWNSFYLSIGIAGSANFAKAQAMKATLAAITNVETAIDELAALVW